MMEEGERDQTARGASTVWSQQRCWHQVVMSWPILQEMQRSSLGEFPPPLLPSQGGDEARSCQDFSWKDMENGDTKPQQNAWKHFCRVHALVQNIRHLQSEQCPSVLGLPWDELFEPIPEDCDHPKVRSCIMLSDTISYCSSLSCTRACAHTQTWSLPKSPDRQHPQMAKTF